MILKALHRCLLAGVIGCTLIALAQSPVSATKPSTSPVAINVYDRLRTDANNWYADPPYTSTYPYVEQLLRISVAQRMKHFDWAAELASADVFDLPTTAVSPVTAQGSLGLGGNYFSANSSNSLPAAASFRQGYIRYHAAGPDTTIRIGRFEYFEGAETTPRDKTLLWLQTNRIAQRLIGNFGFSNGQRSFDGLDGHYGKGTWDLAGMAGRATQGVFNMNANPELNVDLQYLAFTKRQFQDRLLFRTFAIGFHDGRIGIAKTDNRALAARQADHKNIRVGAYGADVLAAVPVGPGAFDLLFWGVLQNGQWGALLQQAAAFATEAGYRFTAVASKPWVRGGVFRSTGDHNNSDTVHNTFFQILPTARVYARFPFYDMQNSTDSFVQVVDNPTKKLEIRSDLHFLRLTSSSDLWYQGGGAYDTKTFGYAGRPSGGHNSLASVADISSDYQLTPNFALNLYYAHSYGRSVIASDYVASRSADFGYLELVYKWGVKQRSTAAK